MKQIESVAIIGAGTQGSMLAFRSLAYGKTVTLYSRTMTSCQRARLKIAQWLEEWAMAGKLQVDPGDAMANLTIAPTIYAAVSHADLVIENVPEVLELKQKIWLDIDLAAAPYTLLTTNSSSLKSSEIGALVSRKEKTFNLNFMTPTADDMVEVMWNEHTNEDTKRLALQFLRELRHVPVVTQKEIKGFSLNRVWRAIKKECLALWSQGYITPEDLDRAWMLEWGTPYGPFGLMDKVGLDIIMQIEESYFIESQKPDDLPPQALMDLVARGELGVKSGKGFYTYPNPAYLRAGWLRNEGQ